MSHAEIMETFGRLEREAGGVALADTKAVAQQTADALGITYEAVRAALLDDIGLWG
ncbi:MULTISPECIES: hypothetical protein [Pseudomonadota]|uniref:hypothetical protein n=1 Tax=Pseudomonadota TaxID=1224 RepID=UPI0026268B52|nr:MULTISPECIES: hypothetical protein [Pseudomonadota]